MARVLHPVAGHPNKLGGRAVSWKEDSADVVLGRTRWLLGEGAAEELVRRPVGLLAILRAVAAALALFTAAHVGLAVADGAEAGRHPGAKFCGERLVPVKVFDQVAVIGKTSRYFFTSHGFETRKCLRSEPPDSNLV